MSYLRFYVSSVSFLSGFLPTWTVVSEVNVINK